MSLIEIKSKLKQRISEYETGNKEKLDKNTPDFSALKLVEVYNTKKHFTQYTRGPLKSPWTFLH